MIKILCLDIGLKRIGVSISFNGDVVIPKKPIFRKNRNQASQDISKIIEELKIDILVVGIPKDSQNTEEMSIRIKHFISLINLYKNIKIYYQDEQGSSYEAKELSKGIFRHKKDGKIDSLASQIILESWLRKYKKSKL